MAQRSDFVLLASGGAQLIRSQRDKGRELKEVSSRRPDWQLRPLHESVVKWRQETAKALDKAFGTTKQHYEFLSVTSRLDSFPFPMAFMYLDEAIDAGVTLLEEYITPPAPAPAVIASSSAVEAPASAAAAEPRQPSMNGRVFIIHGHNEAMIHRVARFIQQIRCEPVILGERIDGGRTLIEKFEQEADVQFAIVLMSPDDVVVGSTSSKRSRQNVIFELGYFYGRLGRGRVMLLREGEVEVPSDLHGIVYAVFDGYDGWKLRVVKELECAGFVIDRSRL